MEIDLFGGRMSRKNFILSQLTLTTFAVLIGMYVMRDGFSIASLTSFIPFILILIPLQFVCSYRRLHDINQTGLWAFLLIAPYISIPFFIYISYKKGDILENDHGIPDTRSFIDSMVNKKFE